MNESKVCIIGMGDDGPRGLSAPTLRRIEEAEILFGGDRHLSFFPHSRAEKIMVKSNLKEVASRIRSELGKKRIVVIASGDPLFYGIGRYLLSQIPKEQLEIIPNVSSMQLAFSKIKESWEDAVLLSVHARPIEETIEVVSAAKKVAFFTDDENTPSRIATELLQNGIEGYRAFVCENLGGEEERIHEMDLSELIGKDFSSLNVLILVKKPYTPTEVLVRQDWTPGISEHEFYQRKPEKGLITKTEVRVISLSKMALRPSSTVWDIGAGSGSVAIESALIAREGLIYAIEKNAEDAALIRKNVEKFGTHHVAVIQGIAPACLSEIPDNPDAVFIGGSAGGMGEIIRISIERMSSGGHLVINAATIENLAEATEGLKAVGLRSEVILANIARSRPILDLTRFESLNPVFIINAQKGVLL